ncbi:MAG TPA: hypothetical protein VKD90_23600 [Gemmataceae bacterium]|nr:hypothetical protein [Gemmataceae bacterium]
MTFGLPSRRQALAAGAALFATRLGAAPDRPVRVAAIVTTMQHRSHAHVILENFLEPYLFRGKMVEPGMRVVSMFVDQVGPGDMSAGVAKDYGIEVYPTVAEALYRKGKDLAVDAILLIGEHGKYPTDARGVVQYPRKRLFDDCVRVIRDTKRPVPIFCDKHLSYRWDWAKEMVDTARELKVPFQAGSSVPLAQRWPDVPQPGGAVRHAVSVHGGPFEGYDIHALEVLQSVMEARGPSETGISKVQFLGADAIWEFASKEPWLVELGDQAMAAELGPGQPSLPKLVRTPAFRATPHAIVLDYRDGLRAAVLKVGGSATRWNLAWRPAAGGKDVATRFYVGPWDNRNLFKALSHAIQHLFRTGRPPYPVERTLLTTGALCAAVDSRERMGAAVETPHLHIEYTPRDFSAFREDGASWKILTEGTPEPKGITRGGHRPPD